MPLTFLAHQAPLFPLRRRFPIDGVAFVAGTLAPDLSAVTLDTTPHYIGWGMPIWHDGHQWSEQLQWCLPVGLLIAFLVRRLLAPTLVPRLPRLGDWNLSDLAVLGRGRHRWWTIVLSVLAGSATHLVLDGITHENRPGGVAVGALGTPLLSAGGRTLTIGLVAQVVVSLVLCVYTYRRLRIMASNRWGVEPTGASEPERATRSGTERLDRAVLVSLGAAAALAGIAAATQSERGLKIVIMTWLWLSLFGAVAIALAVRLVGWLRPAARLGGTAT